MLSVQCGIHCGNWLAALQGMMANRFCATFAEPASIGCEGSASLKGKTPGIMGWNKRLNGVADVYSLMNEIQRTWAYLESLFIHSDEVKKELPEATKRFEKIDINVKVCSALAQHSLPTHSKHYSAWHFEVCLNSLKKTAVISFDCFEILNGELKEVFELEQLSVTVSTPCRSSCAPSRTSRTACAHATSRACSSGWRSSRASSRCARKRWRTSRRASAAHSRASTSSPPMTCSTFCPTVRQLAASSDVMQCQASRRGSEVIYLATSTLHSRLLQHMLAAFDSKHALHNQCTA